MLPPGTKPTRDSVVAAVSEFNQRGEGWHSLRRPDLSPDSIKRNSALVRSLGLDTAPGRDYGRLIHPTLSGLGVEDIVDSILQPWTRASYSPGWRHDDILQYLTRLKADQIEVQVLLLERQGGGPRERRWDPELGFVNLFQGPDLDYRPGAATYPGDRNLFARHSGRRLVELQVHRVHPRDDVTVPELFTLAINIGTNVVVRRGIS